MKDFVLKWIGYSYKYETYQIAKDYSFSNEMKAIYIMALSPYLVLSIATWNVGLELRSAL